MKQRHMLMAASTALLLTATTSCQKEKFDEEEWNKYVDYEFMIENVDKTHEWELTKTGQTTLKFDERTYWIEVLTENPYTSKSAEIAVRAMVDPKRDSEVSIAYAIPTVQTQLYAAALNSNGQYIGVKPFTYGTEQVDLTEGLTSSGSLTKPTEQTFTYCFEEDFPDVGDFDYNDVVLRISKGVGDASYQVRLTVTLQAVGGKKQLAGAIRLAGVKYEDLYSIKMEEEETEGIMDADYPLRRTLIGTSDIFLKGRNGDAVINLFEDAHWAMVRKVDIDGSLLRPYVNTQNATADDERSSMTLTPVTRHYLITFRDREQARNFTFAQIDPFILEGYNGGTWEVHTHPYKLVDVLKNIFRGNESAYDNHIAWAIAVPQSKFRYPKEGMAIGTFANQSAFGAYYTKGHGFSDWMQDKSAANDWYLYPQTNLTYSY